jgi:formylglycine-generating enzyme
MPRTILAFCAGALLFSSLTASAVTIGTVPVGNAGNASDPDDGNDASGVQNLGAVAYAYRIGTTEVTNAQYAAFLNAKAASDPFSLYNTLMGDDARGGIARGGSDGSYSYTVRTNMGNKPVNFVSWHDALRFANWLHNGQGTGDTETGAYTLLGGTPTPSNDMNITRNPGAMWFLPSEDEWYKAAYYDPTLGGGSGGYWDFPTRSNSPPTPATANSVGDISNPGANVANYNEAADWNSLDGNVTTVGSAGPLSESYYGTSDQGGSLFEWNELFVDDDFGGYYRGFRGGAWNGNFFPVFATDGAYMSPSAEFSDLGFRVAMIPEPSTLALGAVGALGIYVFARKRRR